MAILVRNSIFFSSCVDGIINHPDGGEEEEDDEENLQVRTADVDVVIRTAADQGAAQDQDVYTNDRRQPPSPVSDPFPRNSTGRDVQLRLTCVPHLAHCIDVVGQVGLLCFPVFGRHPTWFTRIAIGQTFARIASVQTHDSSL